MLKIEINEKEYNIPQSFDELTLKQYQMAFNNLPKYEGDDEDVMLKYRHSREQESIIISRILGEDDNFCLDLPLDIYNRIAKEFAFIYGLKDFMKNTKAYVKIDGKRYMIPSHEEMSMRQYIDADMSKDNFIEMLAILLLERKDGEFVRYDGKYEKMIPKVEGLSCSDALPLLFHYFKKKEIYKRISKASLLQAKVSQMLQNGQVS